MEMELKLLETGEIELTHHALRIVEDKLPTLLMKKKESTNKKTILRCSICNRLKIEDKWQEPTVNLPGVTEEIPLPVVHTVCESCFQSVKEKCC
jgi:hypothetical protein